MRAVTFVSFGCLSVASAAGGCGGATDTGLFGSGTGDGDSGASPDANGTDGGTRRDGGQRDAGGSDTSVTPPDPGIYCGRSGGGDVNCEVGVATCCATNLGPASTAYECVNNGTVCTGLDIVCNDTADCGGKICCASFDATLGYTAVRCQSTCNGTPRVEMLRFCDPTAVVDECAASARMCTGTSMSLPGYFFCR